MELYVKTMFVIYILAALARSLSIYASDYPKIKTVTFKEDLSVLLVTLGFLAWVIHLLFM